MSRSNPAGGDTPRHRRSTVFACASISGLLLTGCSETPTSSEQGTFDAGTPDSPVVRVVPFGDASTESEVANEPASESAPEDSLDAGLGTDAGTARTPAPSVGASTPDAGARTAEPSPGSATQPAGSGATPTATCTAGVPQTVTHPTGAFQVSVLASGRGCPPCTAHTSLAADGQTFTTTFETFEVSAADADDAPRECTLALRLSGTSGRAYAISSLSLQGAVSLQAGESATQETRHQLQGRAAGGEAGDYAVPGPREGAYTHDAPVATKDMVWSDCALARDLTVRTTLFLTHGEDSKAWVSLHEPGGQLRFKLESRACTP